MLVALLIALQLIDVTTCKDSPKIVGGDYVTNSSEYPYVAYLRIKCLQKTDQSIHACGASILNQRVLVTAAHCLERCKKNSYTLVSVGHYDRAKGTVYSAHSYLLHEDYKETKLENDIALVAMTNPIKFSNVVQRIAIMRNPPKDKKGWLAGWGRHEDERHVSKSILKHLEQYVLTPEKCQKEMSCKLPRGTFCASNDEANYASFGDSGSALVIRKYIQIGLVSYKMTKKSKHTTAYTDVGYFYNWISEMSEEVYCDALSDDKTCLLL